MGVYGIAIDIHNNCPIHKHKHAQVCYSPLMFTSDEPHQNTCTHDGRHKMRHKTFSPHATLAFTHIPVHTIRQTHEKLEAQNLSPHATLAYKHTYVRTQNVKHRKSLRHGPSASPAIFTPAPASLPLWLLVNTSTHGACEYNRWRCVCS